MAEKIEITLLGTGSATPTAKRNHTAILISRGSKNILVDCGEGTQRQFRVARINPCKLTHLLITHWHGDHTFGIPGLLETLMTEEYPKTLQIYGPQKTKRNLSLIEEIFGRFKIKHKVKEISSGKIMENEETLIETLPMKHIQPCNAYAITIKDKLRIDKKKLSKLKLPHSPKLKQLQEGKDITINGKKIRAKNLTYLEKGKKITIILDTAMNNNAIKIAKNSDFLICEASFTEKERKKANKYKHLTAKEAATIAKKAKVKKLILTHISRRYEKDYSPILKEAKKVFKNSYTSKDLDKIRV